MNDSSDLERFTVTLSNKMLVMLARAYEHRINDAASAMLCFEKNEILRRTARLERCRAMLAHRLSLSTDDGEQRVLFGAVFLARSLEHYLSCLIALKESRGKDAWSELMDAQGHLNLATARFVPESAEDALKKFHDRLKSLEEYCFPGMQFQSAAFEVIREECSICGKSMLDCDHTPGQVYGNKLCQRVNLDVRLVSVSLVDEPRDRKAVVTEFHDYGKTYSVFDGTRVDIPDGKRFDSGAISGTAMTTSLPFNPLLWTSLRRKDNQQTDG